MDQGKSVTNGPHQGAWVNTQTGEDWFLHFQDKDAYGRVVHLQPLHWKDNWPVIGADLDGDGKGEPVSVYKKPNVGQVYPVTTPAESDEFNSLTLGAQWQWMANPKTEWMFLNAQAGTLRLYSAKVPADGKNLWAAPNVLLQKFPAQEFEVTTKMAYTPNVKLTTEKAGLTIMGMSYASLSVKRQDGALYLVFANCAGADKGKPETEETITKLTEPLVWLRVTVSRGGKCQFSYSKDDVTYTNAGAVFTAEPGRWKGAKVGLFCVRNEQVNDSGYADFDWFRITAIK
jgi:beta-xylosidase